MDIYKRDVNFTKEEIELLLTISMKHVDIIESKKSDRHNIAKKDAVWEEITDAFNARNMRPRGNAVLRKKYFNLRTSFRRSIQPGVISQSKLSKKTEQLLQKIHSKFSKNAPKYNNNNTNSSNESECNDYVYNNEDSKSTAEHAKQIEGNNMTADNGHIIVKMEECESNFAEESNKFIDEEDVKPIHQWNGTQVNNFLKDLSEPQSPQSLQSLESSRERHAKKSSPKMEALSYKWTERKCRAELAIMKAEHKQRMEMREERHKIVMEKAKLELEILRTELAINKNMLR